MDLAKAQRLLNKIQALLDDGNGHELSRLEKDLIKSYVQQLYEAVTIDESGTSQEGPKNVETSLHKNIKTETPVKKEIPAPRIEVSKPEVLTTAHAEYVNPVPQVETSTQQEWHAPEVKEKSVEIEEKPEVKFTRPVADPVKEEVFKHEPVKETFHAP